jgi:transcriptional regulator with XRE-family HTH domain
MLNGIQHKISQMTRLSEGFISQIVQGKRRPSWKNAKKLAAATHTRPILWLDGTPAEIRASLAQLKIEYKITRNENPKDKKNPDRDRFQPTG